jgi:uncharacterized protein YcbX
MHLSALFIYPVKSLRGCAVSSAAVDGLGLAGDRRFLVVDENDRFLTQRAHARMALVETKLDAHRLTLRADGAGEMTVSRAPDPAAELRAVTVWKSEGLLAEDCGDAPAAWLTEFLGVKSRLVRIGPKFLRPILKGNVSGPREVLAFADSVPFLVVGEGSLADLNDRLITKGETPVPMNRFRPNLVVTGAVPYAEDGWPRIRIGAIAFRAAGPCARCIVTTTDQVTGERHHEPLRMLATYRRDPVDSSEVNFGQNFVHETKSGVLHVGDAVSLLA